MQTSETPKKEIKETKELFAGLALVAKATKKIAADRKVSAEDIPHVIDLAKESPALIAAVDGVTEVPAELKDLSKEELLELIMLVYKEIA